MSSDGDKRRTDGVRLPRELRWLLARLRWSIRAVAWLDGLAATAVWLGAAFFLLWLVDWSFEPSWTVRQAALLAAAAGTAAIVFRLIVRRSFTRLPRASLAALVERKYPAFGDRLLTAVDLCDRPIADADGDASGRDEPTVLERTAMHERTAMLERTAAEACHVATGVRVRHVFRGRPLFVRTAAAVGLAVALVATWLFAGDALAFYLQRLAGSPEPWPRKTLLVVEGFWAEYALVVPQGQSASDRDEVHVYTGAVDVRQRRARQENAERSVVDAGTGASIGGESEFAIATTTFQPAAQIVAPIGEQSRFAAHDDSGGVAVLRRTVDCLWRGDARAYRAGARLSLGRYELISGRAELVLSGGTRVLVAGPAAFEIAASTKIVLDYGRVSVRAPLRPAAFVIETPRAVYEAAPVDRMKVVRGGDVTLTVLADALRTLPEYVEATYRGEGGADGRQMLQQEAAAIPGRDEFQRYTLSLKNLLGSLELDIRGGDGRVSGVMIEAVDSPKLSATQAQCKFPAYLVDRRSGRFTPRTFDVAGPLELPVGTEVTLRARSSKPLRKVEITAGDGQTQTIDVSQSGAAQSSAPDATSDGHEFVYPVGPLERTTALFITLHDADGVANRDPIAVQLIAVPDEPPRVNVRLFGVGSTITPSALLRLQGEIADDHGLARGWMAVDVAGEQAAEHPLADELAGQRRVALATVPWRGGDASSGDESTADEVAQVQETLDLAAFRLPSGRALEAGDQLMVSVRAADRCDLREKPAIGESDRVPLEVVTVDDLLARLEVREVLLHDKLAVVIDELEQTRDALGTLKSAGDETDASAHSTTTATRRPLGPQVERAVQNSERSRYETATLASVLDEIGEELATNRLDTPPRRARLAEQLIVPLRSVVAEGYPKFDARLAALGDRAKSADQLAQLRGQLAALKEGDEAVAVSQRIAELEAKLAAEPSLDALVADAQAEADRVIVALRGVLGELADAGDFNQLVDELREITKRQQQLRERTRKEQQKSLLE